MEPTLYILMRDDLDSLNPGKAIAQGSHATNLFDRDSKRAGDDTVYAIEEWAGDRGFGRCLTVSAKVHEMEEIMALITDDPCNFLGNTVLDPTYPISDGTIIHTLPLITCAYVFVYDPPESTYSDSLVIRKLKKLSLYA